MPYASCVVIKSWLASRRVGAPPEHAGGAYTAYYVCARRRRATSLSPRPSGGLFWLLNGGTGTLACAQRTRQGMIYQFNPQSVLSP